MEASERAWREEEGVVRTREKLKFRVYSAVRGVVLSTDLFRAHAELYEPDVFVNVYAEAVDVLTTLNEGQLRLLRSSAKAKDLVRFAEQLEEGLRRSAADLQLELTTDPARLGGSRPYRLWQVPSGYRAVLLRRASE